MKDRLYREWRFCSGTALRRFWFSRGRERALWIPLTRVSPPFAEFDISQETFADLVPMAESGTDGHYSLRGRYHCAYTDEQVDALIQVSGRSCFLWQPAGTTLFAKTVSYTPIYWLRNGTPLRSNEQQTNSLLRHLRRGMAIPGNPARTPPLWRNTALKRWWNNTAVCLPWRGINEPGTKTEKDCLP